MVNEGLKAGFVTWHPTDGALADDSRRVWRHYPQPAGTRPYM